MDIPADNDDGHLHVDSVTGVPLDLTIAGPGGRSFAFVIDFHIRALGAIAWYFGGWLLLQQYLKDARDPPDWLYVLVVLPPLVMYLLYHPILEIAMAGRTPGKRMAGVRIVTVEGMVPGAGAIVVRNLFRFVDGLPIMYLVGLVTTIVTRRNQRIGDLAAGTLLIYDDGGKSESLEGLSGAGIDRWATLDSEDRLDLARRLLARLDPGGAHTQTALLNDANALIALQHWLGGIR